MVGRPVVENQVIELSRHAIDRYIERVKPGATFDQAAEDITRLSETIGRLTQDRPGWSATHRNRYPELVGFLTLGDDVALPLVPAKRNPCRLFAPTCLVKGALGDTELDWRRAKRRTARHEERARRRNILGEKRERQQKAHRKHVKAHMLDRREQQYGRV